MKTNTIKTGILLAALTVLLIVIGQALGGVRGATTAFVFTLVMNLVTYWFSDKIVLAMYRAKPLSESETPELFQIVGELARQSEMPMPKLFLIQTVTPNAFATGRDPNHASVAVTSGLMEIMDGEELKGVLAHELSHVKNRDTLVMTIAAAIAGAVMWLADMARWGLIWGPRASRDDRRGSSNALQIIVLLAVVILAPLAAILIQLAISRTREYGADESGARLSGSPAGLARALEKLDQAARHRPMPHVNPATAHLFIVNPLSADTIAQLFSTHPPVKERVRRLQMLAS